MQRTVFVQGLNHSLIPIESNALHLICTGNNARVIAHRIKCFAFNLYQGVNLLSVCSSAMIFVFTSAFSAATRTVRAF
jgi:hypothetical protein